MNAMKGLFLASAAGLVAMSSAQAADLPVKAKPVEYVKVCSLYGAGFFYVPGTDTCLKIGMYLRSDHGYGSAFNVNSTYGTTDTAVRTSNYYTYRARINLTTDWRTQSDYGVIRAYAAIIAQQGIADTSPNSPNAATANGLAGILRAFIQFAGFTVGHAVSYFDFTNYADYGYEAPLFASTGVNGIDIIAYTWQLGNGVSASIDLEDAQSGRTRILLNASAAGMIAANGTSIGTASVSNNSSAIASRTPDIAGNIRIDQAWGSAQISGAAHNASAGYYAGTGTNAAASTQNGHPGDTWGWAVQAGLRLNNFLMPKDSIEGAFVYGKGASAYVMGNPQNLLYGSGNSVALAQSGDGVYVTGSGIELTENWSLSAAYQHYWNAQWRTSVFGGMTQTNYSGTAKGMLCGTNANSAGVLGGLVTGTGAFVCNPDFKQYSFSTRTAWNPHPTLEIGLDLLWFKVDSNYGGTATLAANGVRPGGSYTFSDQERVGAILRVQKTILP